MYGDFFAYLYGWAAFAVINTASVASIAFIFAQYTEYFVLLPRFSDAVEKSWQLSMPFIGHVYPLGKYGCENAFRFYHCVTNLHQYPKCKRRVVFVQLVFSFAKIGAILLMVAMIFFSGKGNASNFTQQSIFYSSLGHCIDCRHYCSHERRLCCL